MQKNKFLFLLKKLSRQELEDFHKYLKRNHQGEKIALRAFEYLIRFYPDFEQKDKISLASVYQKSFKTDFDPDERGQKNMQNTASQLGGWLKNFLIISKVQQDASLQQMIWLGILQERDLKDEFSRKAAAFYQQTRSTPFKSPADALPNWMASYFHREHISWVKPLMQAKIIEQCTETMTSCWEIIRLKMACEMSMVKRITDEAAIQKMKAATDFQQLGISILKDTYAALWRLTDTGEAEHFIHLELLLKQHGQHIDPKELEWVIRYAYNFTAHQSRLNPDPTHYERMHNLNKIGIAHGVFLRDGYLPSSAFGNFVQVACLAKDFVWAARFIQEYSRIVLENDRTKAILLAQAILAYETGKFREVLNLIEDVDFHAHLDILRSKSLLLRSYYELQADQDTILDTCAYFENLLRHSPKVEAVKAMLAFTLILKKLATQRSSKKVILDCINKAPVLYSKTWLLEKTQQYIAKYAERKLAPERHTLAI